MEWLKIIVVGYVMIGGNYAIYLLMTGRIEPTPGDFLFEAAIWPLTFAAWVQEKLQCK